MKSLFLSSLFFICLLLSKLYGLGVNGIVAFGDSLSCNGNACIYALEPADICIIYPQGRFTDGDVWLEVLADELDLPRPRPSLAGGYNFAYGGATTGWDISTNLLNVGHQVEAYLQRVGGQADPRSLYVLWVGGNDIKNKIIPKSLIPNLKKHITELARAGAKTFLIPNYPPLAKTPLISGAAGVLGWGLAAIGDYFQFEGTATIRQSFSMYADQAADFGIQTLNRQLKHMLLELEQSLQITIYHFDAYTLFHEVTNNLHAFGLSENDHLFLYDGFHPSRVVHRILGQEAYKFLNEPKVFRKSPVQNQKKRKGEN